MSQTHADTEHAGMHRLDAQDPAQPPRSEQTAPVWFDHTQELPAHHPAFGPGADEARDSTGEAAASEPPAGPPPTVPTPGGAEHAQPANRRRWTELTAVAALAAILASGGTYAATQLGASQPSSSASASTLGRGTDTGPVVQANANNPNWTATAAAVSPSVVSITVQSGQGTAQGSGVVIDTHGHVLTNNHVVSGMGQGATINVTLKDGRTFKATVAGTDASTDLAVLTLASPPSDLKPIAFGSSDELKVGDPVMAIGNPLGLAGTATTGIVSALNRPVTTQADSAPQDPFGNGQSNDASQVVTNAIQTSAAINPGNSGGALVNGSGQLIGINSAIASVGSGGSGQSGSIGIGFAIPVNEAKRIAQQLITKGTADHAFLGVTLQDATASDGASRRAGAQVTAVSSGTPAAAAGLRRGDLVIGVDGDAVDSSLALVANIRERAVGDKVTLTVLRGGKQISVTTTLVAKAAASQ